MADEPDTTSSSDEPGSATPPDTTQPDNTTTGDTTSPDSTPATGDAAKPDEDWKARSRTWEDRAKANKTAADKAAAEAAKASETLTAVRKAFGLDGTDEEDPKTAAEKAAAERDAKDAELRTLKIERAAEKVGRKVGADVDLLLDSRGFATGIAKLDPADDTFDDDLKAAVEKALADNPRLKAAAPPAATATADTTGGGEPAKGELTVDSAREERRKRRAG